MRRPSSITWVFWVGAPSSSIASAPPLARQAAVVVGAEQRLGDLLAELADVDAGALVDVVGLEPVAGHLVEEDAAEAAADHHRHRAGRGRAGVEQGQRLARRPARRSRPGSSSSSSKPRWAPSVSAPVSTASPRRATAWAPIRTRVRSSPLSRPVGVGDGDLAAGLGVGGGELGDLAALAAGALVELAQQRRLALGRHLLGPALDRQRRSSRSPRSGRGSERSPRSAAAASSAARSRSAGSRPSTWAK